MTGMEGCLTVEDNVSARGMVNVDWPFLVKVSLPDLNVRKGAGMNTAKTGEYTGLGCFTIVEVKSAKDPDFGHSFV